MSEYFIIKKDVNDAITLKCIKYKGNESLPKTLEILHENKETQKFDE